MYQVFLFAFSEWRRKETGRRLFGIIVLRVSLIVARHYFQLGFLLLAQFLLEGCAEDLIIVAHKTIISKLSRL
jgi:small-conductance mechanosensitive channel